MFSEEKLNQLFDSFNKLKVLVIGDIMLDAYVWGKVDRISPEAPVPIVSIEKRVNKLGGAANVALNLKSLGAEPIICSVIGDDQKGSELINELNVEALSAEGIIKSADRITTTKFRVIGNNTQMLRVDEEDTCDLNVNEEIILIDKIKVLLGSSKIDAIIFQDYNKGNLTKKLIGEVISLANKLKIVTTVDPKHKNFFEFKKVSLFKPNLKELQEGLNVSVDDLSKENITDLAKKLNEKLGAKMIMTTLSEHGVFIAEALQTKNINAHLVPAHKRSISDVSGAGDTVISVATLCLVLSQNLQQIAALSNLAGGIVCEEVGVTPVSRDRLLIEAVKLLTK